MINEQALEVMDEELTEANWNYLGAGQWEDPVTACKYSTVAAYEILKQRMGK